MSSKRTELCLILIPHIKSSDEIIFPDLESNDVSTSPLLLLFSNSSPYSSFNLPDICANLLLSFSLRSLASDFRFFSFSSFCWSSEFCCSSCWFRVVKSPICFRSSARFFFEEDADGDGGDGRQQLKREHHGGVESLGVRSILFRFVLMWLWQLWVVTESIKNYTRQLTSFSRQAGVSSVDPSFY